MRSKIPPTLILACAMTALTAQTTSADPRPVSSSTPRPSLELTASPGAWKQHPQPTEMRTFWDRPGRAIRRSTSQFFGIIRVGRQYAVSPANPGDPVIPRCEQSFGTRGVRKLGHGGNRWSCGSVVLVDETAK